MKNGLSLKNEYKIVFKKLLFKKEFLIVPRVDIRRVLNDNKFEKKLLDKFRTYGMKVDKVENAQLIFLNDHHFIESFNLWIYELSTKENQSVLAMEIMDVAVFPKYRSKGIGRQLMLLLDEVASENNIKFIVGELQEDRIDEPLEKRKRFFEKSGFEVWEDKESHFSGWVIKKQF